MGPPNRKLHESLGCMRWRRQQPHDGRVAGLGLTWPRSRGVFRRKTTRETDLEHPVDMACAAAERPEMSFRETSIDGFTVRV